ncbi:MAG: hypothetical protein KAI24_00425, partial [Planctomycetes bacterium]|nr:hypothetical protein [Planctomycetota bacterium]
MHSFINRRVVGACLLAATATSLCAQERPAAQALLIEAGRIVVAPGTVLTDSALLVRDGKVAYVGDDIPAEARQGARVVDYGSATVSPGFVLAATTLGNDADLAEGALAFTPDLRVAEAFDPWSDRLEHVAPYGVTSFGLTPSP